MASKEYAGFSKLGDLALERFALDGTEQVYPPNDTAAGHTGEAQVFPSPMNQVLIRAETAEVKVRLESGSAHYFPISPASADGLPMENLGGRRIYLTGTNGDYAYIWMHAGKLL